MFASYLKLPHYRVVYQVDHPESDGRQSSRSKPNSKLRLFAYWSFIAVCLLAIGWFMSRVFKAVAPESWYIEWVARLPRCHSPRYRREWRSLSSLEKEDYIGAVRCLLSQPSRVRPNGVLYNDYPHAHAQHAAHTHNAAPFLPWHRYFLHVYETDLRNLCAYQGSLPYWDWTLDWESLASSPVFSNETGFGGNGNHEAGQSVGGGYCVADGPFSDLVLPFYNSDDHDHCLSRGFLDGEVEGKLPGDQVKPSAVEQALEQPDYRSFLVQLEKGPHNQIPNGIGGDFLKFTAPNDPLFFLHHSQLDRLWWLWQHAGVRARRFDYGGLDDDDRSATLSDHISVGGLAPAVKIREVMDTEAGFLCYRY